MANYKEEEMRLEFLCILLLGISCNSPPGLNLSSPVVTCVEQEGVHCSDPANVRAEKLFWESVKVEYVEQGGRVHPAYDYSVAVASTPSCPGCRATYYVPLRYRPEDVCRVQGLMLQDGKCVDFLYTCGGDGWGCRMYKRRHGRYE